MVARFELKQASSGKFVFELVDPDGTVLLTSPPFDGKITAQNAISHARSSAGNVDNFARSNDGKGRFFTLKDDKGAMVGRSSVFPTDDALELGIRAVTDHARSANLVDRSRVPRSRGSAAH